MYLFWKYRLSDNLGVVSGIVNADDPRDAVSRALTSYAGIAFARRNSISPDVLFGVPANNIIGSILMERNDYQIEVSKQEKEYVQT